MCMWAEHFFYAKGKNNKTMGPLLKQSKKNSSNVYNQ